MRANITKGDDDDDDRRHHAMRLAKLVPKPDSTGHRQPQRLRHLAIGEYRAIRGRMTGGERR
jgi:hypothetical protein